MPSQGTSLRPRLCALEKGDNGYGFHLHGEKGKTGQFIRLVEPDSPAETSGLRAGDRLVFVNGEDVENESHQQVVTRIRATVGRLELIVVDPDTEELLKRHNIKCLKTHVTHGVLVCEQDGEEHEEEHEEGTVVEEIEIKDEESPDQEETTRVSTPGPEINGDNHVDTQRDTNEDSHSDTHRDSNEDTNGDIREELCKNISEDTREETQEDTSEHAREDTHEDACEDTHEDTHPDVCQSISEDVGEHVQKKLSVGSEQDVGTELRPRLCVIQRGSNGYGFNLHSERARPGQYIRAVDEDSPAERAGLLPKDRIVQVNNVPVEGKTHSEVVAAIKAGGPETRLLVVDVETDAFFKRCRVAPTSEHLTGPLPEPVINGGTEEKMNGRVAKETERDSKLSVSPSPSITSSNASLTTPPTSTPPEGLITEAIPALNLTLQQVKELSHQKRSNKRAPPMDWTKKNELFSNL